LVLVNAHEAGPVCYNGKVRTLRERHVIGRFEAVLREGAYWRIWSYVADFRLADALECAEAATRRLAEVPTLLAKMDAVLQQRLVNWGHAICDTAMCKHVVTGLRQPCRWRVGR
jgi:NTE family protein